jgi:hypothetical protein
LGWHQLPRRHHEINPERKASKKPYISCEPPLADFLGEFDVLTLWTWDSEEIPELEANLTALEKIGPKKARISDMIFLANTMLDVGMPSADFSREWVKKYGAEKLDR